MTIGTKLYTFFHGYKVGEDEFGNKYYRHKNRDIKKRWVIYNGLDEASKVPAEWHIWLHYTSNDIPKKSSKKHKWQQPHTPNLTGTDLAYLPKGHVSKGGERQESGSDYQAWQPDN